MEGSKEDTVCLPWWADEATLRDKPIVLGKIAGIQSSWPVYVFSSNAFNFWNLLPYCVFVSLILLQFFFWILGYLHVSGFPALQNEIRTFAVNLTKNYLVSVADCLHFGSVSHQFYFILYIFLCLPTIFVHFILLVVRYLSLSNPFGHLPSIIPVMFL